MSNYLVNFELELTSGFLRRRKEFRKVRTNEEELAAGMADDTARFLTRDAA